MHTSEVSTLSAGTIVVRDGKRFLIMARFVSSVTADVRGMIVVPLKTLFGGYAFISMKPETKDIRSEWWSDVSFYDVARDVVVLDTFQ